MSLWTCLPSTSPPPLKSFSSEVHILKNSYFTCARATFTFNRDIQWRLYPLYVHKEYSNYIKLRHFILRKCNIKHLQTEGIDSSNSLHENFVTAFGQWASKLVETLYSYQQKTLSPLWMVRLPTCTLSPPLPPPHNVDHQLRSFMGNDAMMYLQHWRGGGGLDAYSSYFKHKMQSYTDS